MKSKNEEKVLMGKRSRRKGLDFELKVRNFLKFKGWIVDKWTNNIDLQDNSIIKAKHNKFHGSTGFPDFFMFRRIIDATNEYEIQFVECKINNTLDKIEKQKIQVLKDMGFCCLVAYEDDGEIKFRNPKEYRN